MTKTLILSAFQDSPPKNHMAFLRSTVNRFCEAPKDDFLFFLGPKMMFFCGWAGQAKLVPETYAFGADGRQKWHAILDLDRAHCVILTHLHTDGGREATPWPWRPYRTALRRSPGAASPAPAAPAGGGAGARKASRTAGPPGCRQAAAPLPVLGGTG